MLPNTIDEVLETLDAIIQETINDGNYLGIFAYVYRRTTAQIKQAIESKAFEDNPAMERFDVLFANLYIQAYFDFKEGKNTSNAWELSFKAKDEPLIIIQHLILGMNAHIHLDLGVAAATFAPGNEIHSIKNDFMKVNQILQELIDEIQTKLTNVSKFMFLLDWIGKDKDEVLAGFSIKKARDFAWNVALKIASTTTEFERINAIQETDHLVTSIGKVIHRPPGKMIAWILSIIRIFEEKKVNMMITKLEQ